MSLRNMLRICLAFWKAEPQYACKGYALKKNMYSILKMYGYIVHNSRAPWDEFVKSIFKVSRLLIRGSVKG